MKSRSGEPSKGVARLIVERVKFKVQRVTKKFGSVPKRQREILVSNLYSKKSVVNIFATGSKPIIRWIKGDGLDDEVTRAAIAQATRIFGNDVDYCLLTQGISAERAREVLSWASQPVEWREISSTDNKGLAKTLLLSGCPEHKFGYWWKWFPERIRPQAPEWILDGDMVIIKKPKWFKAWASGDDSLRVSQTNEIPSIDKIYGRYSSLVDEKIRLYSGFVSLPPELSYMSKFIQVFEKIPLEDRHNGKIDMCEQGVVAAAFQEFSPKPIPLSEFPFGRAFEKDLDFGDEPPNKNYWGIHFGAAFRVRNKHFHQAVDSGQIVSVNNLDVIQKTRWLSGGSGQWGVPGRGISEEGAAFVLSEIGDCSGLDILEIGTSRGRFAFMLNLLGANVTTLDPVDRGANKNLADLKIDVVLEEGKEFLQKNFLTFDLILVDLHGNTDETWQMIWPGISKSVKSGGKVIINNLFLERIDNWQDQNGVRKLADRLQDDVGWKIRQFKVPNPGFLVAEKSND
jgi:hypothetical protein